MKGTCKTCGKSTPETRYEYCNEHYQKKQQSPTPQKNRLPVDYLKHGYFNEAGVLRKELIVSQPKEIAQMLASHKMTSASLRKFFSKVKLAQRQLKSQNNFQAILPKLFELEAYVNNAVVRKVVPSIFQDFIKRNVEIATNSETAFSNGFVKHFEYVVAFFPKKQ